MKMQFFNFKLVVILAAAILIPACGGGGGGSSQVTTEMGQVPTVMELEGFVAELNESLELSSNPPDSDVIAPEDPAISDSEVVQLFPEPNLDPLSVSFYAHSQLRENGEHKIVFAVSLNRPPDREFIPVVDTYRRAPASGLPIMLRIEGADVGDFSSEDSSLSCVDLLCTFMLPEESGYARFTLIVSGSVTSPEDWGISIVGSEDYAINSNSRFAAVAFQAGGLPPPEVSISGLHFDTARQLSYASLGAWFNGNTINADSVPVRFAPGTDNIVLPPLVGDGNGPILGQASRFASYHLTADAAYKGVRFFPKGSLFANFDNGNMLGVLSARGTERSDDSTRPLRISDTFAASEMLPDGEGGVRPHNYADSFSLNFEAHVTPTGIGSEGRHGGRAYASVEGSGFFADFPPVLFFPDFSVTGNFHDDSGYNRETDYPREVSGVINGIVDLKGEKMGLGFVGAFVPYINYVDRSRLDEVELRRFLENPQLLYQLQQERIETNFPAKQLHTLPDSSPFKDIYNCNTC